MAYRAAVDIPRSRRAVWAVLTNVDVWSSWWGGAMRRVEPGWTVDGKVTWARGSTATVTDLEPEARLGLRSDSSGTRWLFELTDGPRGTTRVTFVEDFSDSRVQVSERDAKLAQNEATVVKLRDAVTSRSAAPRKWWQLWK